MKTTIATFATGAALLLASAANAAILTQYGTAGSTTSLAPHTIISGISADNLTAGSGLNVQNYSTFNFSGWDTANTSFSSAVAAGDFWSWGFDVTDNVLVDLTTMDIRLDRSGSGPDDFEIHASLNGGSSVSVLSHDYNDSSSGVEFSGVDLSAFSGLTMGDSLTFVLAAFNSESSGGTFDLETYTFPGGSDALTINGSVTPVPVPAAAWFLGSGLLGLAGFRRFNKKEEV